MSNEEKCPRCGGPAIIEKPYIAGLVNVCYPCDCKKEADDAK